MVFSIKQLNMAQVLPFKKISLSCEKGKFNFKNRPLKPRRVNKAGILPSLQMIPIRAIIKTARLIQFMEKPNPHTGS